MVTAPKKPTYDNFIGLSDWLAENISPASGHVHTLNLAARG